MTKPLLNYFLLVTRRRRGFAGFILSVDIGFSALLDACPTQGGFQKAKKKSDAESVGARRFLVSAKVSGYM